jgi:hypothetical protein
MLEIIRQSIFDTGCDLLVCPVNCKGKMGKGLALDFKRRFPWLEDHYILQCNLRGPMFTPLRPGEPRVANGPDASIVLFPTKNHYRNPSEMWMVTTGLFFMRHVLDELQATPSIAFPALGCGLGELDWEDVRPNIEFRFNDYGGIVKICEPGEYAR